MTRQQHFLPIFSLLLLLLAAAAAAATAYSTPPPTFIKSSCKTTVYPLVCVQSLSAYQVMIGQSPGKLAHTALAVSMARAQSTRLFIKKLSKFRGLKSREYGAIKDCLDEIGDSVERISKSIKELKLMGTSGSKKGEDLVWHMSNVKTWVSAALTDENTCLDGFSGRALDGKIKASVKGRVTHVAQVTSNALAFVNQFASKYY